MASSFFFCLILIIACISLNCFGSIPEKRIQLTYEQGAIRHSLLSRFRRQNGYGAYKNYMQQGAAVQPSVVVIPSGVPPIYRGPGSSYGPSTSYGAQSSYGGYGAQGAAYGVNRVPSVVVNMPDSSSCTKQTKKKKKILD